ncbi:MAG: sigma 54-interacting transcriptional regulator [Acidobacteria bacterium]|nr:sigma 54-interacting transcriptional regulator [Acidobacteriota bacterium]
MAVNTAWRDVRRTAGVLTGVARLMGDSAVMVALRDEVRRAAAAPFPVLIEGESGTGKELVARALHEEGPRRDETFAAVNCATFSDDLIETELFGHAKGAFTGAVQSRRGLLEASSGGTVFLDEVGELSPRAQAKLLRTLQDGEIRKVGENVTRRLDLRVVAATNRTLAGDPAEGRFRRDLLSRLDVVHLQVPPLRDRGSDVARLAVHYWDRTLMQTRGRARLARETMTALAAHEWPGNVRELQNVLAALAVAAPPHGEVGPDLLPAAIRRASQEERPTLAEARRAFDRRFVDEALVRAGGKRSLAARQLGVSRQGLAKLVVRLGLEPPPTR